MSDSEPLPYEERARSFGTIAEHYDRYRPAPPREALEFVLAPGSESVVELGAGTGALTELICEQVPRVVALEPDPEMRRILRVRAPEASVVGGLAEALPFGSDLFDSAVAASSWHWMDPVATPIEVGRVLRSGANLGLLWNSADRSIDWVEEILGRRDVARELVTRARSHRHAPEFGPDAPFHDVVSSVVDYTLDLTPGEMVGLMGSYSRVFTLPKEARDLLLDRTARLAAARQQSTGTTLIELPMQCYCWRAVRD